MDKKPRSRFTEIAGELGLDEVAAALHEDDEAKHASQYSAESVFNAQQMVLANVMVISALLLGFIVTGTLLSIGLTGRDNFGITELIHFFRWSAFAAMFAFISLITSFLTSVWGAHRMTTRGTEEAALALTEGSVIRHIVSEGSLYMSMFFFLVSLYHYVWMVYSGPDICPTFRGPASFCARQGADLYFASAPQCKPICDTVNTSQACGPEQSRRDCLCKEVCRMDWEQLHAWTDHNPDAHRSGMALYNYHFFGFRPLLQISKPNWEKVMVASSSLMCNHAILESSKEDCFAKRNATDCISIFKAWQKSEECMDGSVEDTLACSKVCSWSDGMPPREALANTTNWAFIPLGVTLIILTIGRIFVILTRACAVCRKQQAELRKMMVSVSYNNSHSEDHSRGDSTEDSESA